jgi:hypothetical protein
MSAIQMLMAATTAGVPLFVIQSTYDAARDWQVNGVCHDSTGNTYTAWTTSGILVITKHDKTGVFQSQTSITIGFTGNDSYCMKIAPDGSLYIAGRSSSTGGPALLKLTSALAVSFFKTYNPAPSNATLSYGYFTGMDIDSSGNVYCVGSGAWQVGQNSQSHGWIYKFDSSGDTQWIREYNMGISHGYYSCGLGADGYLYVCGETAEYSSGAYKYYLELAKISSGGSLTTHAKFLGPEYYIYCNPEYGGIYGRQIMFDSTGTNFYVFGSQRPDGSDRILIASFNSSLNLVGSFSRTKSAGHNGGYSRGQNGLVTPTGDLYISASFEYNNNNYTSAQIIAPNSLLRPMINSAATLKNTYFNGMAYNPGNATSYTYGSIKNTTGNTRFRGVVFNFSSAEKIPSTEIDNSQITLSVDSMSDTGTTMNKTVLTGYTSNITSTTATGTYSSGSTYPTLTTTLYS